MIVGPDGKEIILKPRSPGFSTEIAKNWETEPKPNCKWCYGRGYTGIDAKTKEEIICPCILKRIEKNARKFKQKINIKK